MGNQPKEMRVPRSVQDIIVNMTRKYSVAGSVQSAYRFRLNSDGEVANYDFLLNSLESLLQGRKKRLKMIKYE